MKTVFDMLFDFAMECFGFIGVFPLLCGVPLLLAIELTYVAMSLVKGRKILLVASWRVCISLIVSMLVWQYIVNERPLGFPTKGLPNYIELGVMVLLDGVLYATRCRQALAGNVRKMKQLEHIAVAAMPIAAILLAFLFPRIPE